MLATATLLADSRGAQAADRILTDILYRGTVRIATAMGAPPYGFKDENGNLQGYDIDIANLLPMQLGVDQDGHRRSRRDAADQKGRRHEEGHC
ncbi:MAG: transporter substrate-binding domain-containing protein [Alphaproteobacteria bacterium]|nr:transporter substrate-binding domain-containing protein [Alphaproteobacteria bacterium]